MYNISYECTIILLELRSFNGNLKCEYWGICIYQTCTYQKQMIVIVIIETNY